MFLQTMTKQEVRDLMDSNLFSHDSENPTIIWPNYRYLDPTVPPYLWDAQAGVWKVHAPDYSALSQSGR